MDLLTIWPKEIDHGFKPDSCPRGSSGFESCIPGYTIGVQVSGIVEGDFDDANGILGLGLGSTGYGGSYALTSQTAIMFHKKRVDIGTGYCVSSLRTILDSGTVITRFPSSVYPALHLEFKGLMSKYPPVPPPYPDNVLDTCYNLEGYDKSVIPTMENKNVLNFYFKSLPNSYDQLIINLTNNNVTSLVFDDVAAAILQEENRCKSKEDGQVNLQQVEALTTMRGRSTERGQSSSHKHGRSKSKSKKNLKCYNCGKNGHLKKDCWSLNKNSN
ncbi:hypothetical protein F3Y22_tig00001825pilonHSYRG00031 [Hibiscus syriacus]|uniref:CCHC-type domain-containing protein n=1 Tax=Hibiscus syriacus TaxID=106335 RepID=A0A6A3CTD8_HIBSY|nr:hypothetical protein F3Y22_tig00001825pilonHSYRG00031 [Hibiscus syriacus]